MPVYKIKRGSPIPQYCKVIREEGDEIIVRCPRWIKPPEDAVRIHDLRGGEPVTKKNPAKYQI